MASSNSADIPTTQRLREALVPRAAAGATVTYQQLARELELRPPASIHRLTAALEALMTEDASAGRPLLAAVVVSRTRAGLPAPGFFTHARELGCLQCPAADAEMGPGTSAWHRHERVRLQEVWRHAPRRKAAPQTRG